MRKFSCITRKGIINLKNNYCHNQCAKQGHDVYQYTLKVLFDPEVKLNENGFIIDHVYFDHVIQQCDTNSCELMAGSILDAIERLLKQEKLRYLGIKLQIKPCHVIEENSAYFEQCRCHDNKLFLISSL